MTTQATNTVDVILNNAQYLMLKEGYFGVSVDSIIERSGVSKGTFFYHFKSKGKLAERLLERFIDALGSAFIALMEDVKAQQNNDSEYLFDFLARFPEHFQYSVRNGCLIAAFSYQLLDRLPSLKGTMQQAIHRWQLFLAPHIIKALPVNDAEAKALAKTLFCLMEGAFIVEKIESDEELKQRFEHFSHYLRLLAK